MGDRPLSDLATAWLALWNGDLGQLDAIVAEDIVTHGVSPNGKRAEDLLGRQALGAWIRQTHEFFSEQTTYEVGPIVEGAFFVVRWHSTGSYRGGMPGVPPEAVGRSIDFKGIDILCAERGRLVEFWISADLSVLMHQLGGSGA